MKASLRGWPVAAGGVACLLFAALVALVPAGRGAAPPPEPVQVSSDAYAFVIMGEVRRRETRPLWPGFSPAGIPVALFDDDTYLFDYPGLPQGFSPIKDMPGAALYRGRHPAVSGNRRVKIDGVWTATVVPRAFGPQLGRPYTLSEIAGVVIHEKFHVFQTLRHPDWKPNDAVLLDYPLDTDESLFLRRMETEALRRAIFAAADGESAGWTRAALAFRAERLAGLPGRHAGYEREVQRLEGLAEYVEYKAADRPEAPADGPAGFAPRAAREMGYQGGRREAVLLDRLDPGWKDALERGEFRYLEQRLADLLRDTPGAAFSAAELSAARAKAVEDVAAKEKERADLVASFKTKPGTAVDFLAAGHPLHVEMFDPLAIEAIAPGVMLHFRWLLLRSDTGAAEIVNRPCLTEIDERGRVVRLLVTGLEPRAPVAEWHGRITVAVDGLTAAFKSARVLGRLDHVRVFLN